MLISSNLPTKNFFYFFLFSLLKKGNSAKNFFLATSLSNSNLFELLFSKKNIITKVRSKYFKLRRYSYIPIGKDRERI